MCGIAGIYNVALDRAGQARTLRAMLGTMVHRGPDADGEWFDPQGRCALGHRRLSIIDTSEAGRQPLRSSDSRWLITFNGEIYNYRELTTEVTAAGMQPHGRTDTEVLANAIALWGTEAFSKLDGQFAFAAFDTLSGRLIVARDPFGEKPLYFIETESAGVIFASELQALEQCPQFDGEVSVDAVAELMMFQYVGAPRTIYKNIRKLPPGHWLVLDPGQPVQMGRYFRLAPGEAGLTERRIDDLIDELEHLLVKSVERRLISDVPLGAFLSGGVDSSTVCAMVRRKLRRPLQTFSIGFAGSPESEHKSARAFARHLGTEHFEKVLAPSASAFLRSIGSLLDEPNADSSCLPTYLLAQFARTRVTVALSGDGGDELFGGYGRYSMTLDEEAGLRSAAWSPGSAYYSDRILIFTEPLLAEFLGAVPAGLSEHIARLRREVDRSDVPLLCRMRKTDVDNYMPGAVLAKVDRMSMRHSLEVRTPFLNVELARFAERLPPSLLYDRGRTKVLLRELAARHLPRHLVEAPKKGFGLPMARWAKNELLTASAELLQSDDSLLRAALGTEVLDPFMDRQRLGKGLATYQVWTLAMLESWLRHHPARLDDLKSFVRVNGARRPRHGLRGMQLGENLYAVFEAENHARRSRFSTSQQTSIATIASGLFLQNPRAWRFDSISEEGIGEDFSFPGWEAPVSESQMRRLSMLEGALVLLPDRDAGRRLDHANLAKLAALGIKAVAFLDPYLLEPTVVQIAVRKFTFSRRLYNGIRLLPRAIAFVGWGSRFRAFFKRRREGSTDRAYLSGRLSRAPQIAETELSNRVMLFEGLRQMPPCRASHVDIAALGGGRYSVWSQRCVYSPTTSKRLLTRPYWLVQRDAVTDAFLEFLPVGSPPELFAIAPFCAVLQKLISKERDDARSAVLNVGDHVMLVTHALPPGGAERQWCYLAEVLKRWGYRVSFVVTSELQGESAHYLPLLRASDIEPIELAFRPLRETAENNPCDPIALGLLSQNPFGLRLARMTGLLGALQPKAVLAQLDDTNLLVGTAALLAGVPRTILSFRNYHPMRFLYIGKPWYLPLYQQLIESPRILLSGNSRRGNADYASWLGIAPAEITYIPNAIAAEEVADINDQQLRSVREKLGLPQDAPVILGVFRLSEEKRPRLFVDVCLHAINANPTARALIVGTGPLRSELQQYIAQNGAGDRVHLLGQRTDVDVLMKIASLLLLTSVMEGMPNVLMEAQRAALPIVATDVGGVRDCVVDGRTGFVVPPDDTDALVRACLRLLSDLGLARSMGEHGAAWIRQAFSKEAMGERYLQLARQPEKRSESAESSRARAIPV